MRNLFLYIGGPLVALLLIFTWFYPGLIWVTVVVLALFLVGIYNITQERHTILRNFPVLVISAIFLNSFLLNYSNILLRRIRTESLFQERSGR